MRAWAFEDGPAVLATDWQAGEDDLIRYLETVETLSRIADI